VHILEAIGKGRVAPRLALARLEVVRGATRRRRARAFALAMARPGITGQYDSRGFDIAANTLLTCQRGSSEVDCSLTLV
jgi:hypothetical protein